MKPHILAITAAVLAAALATADERKQPPPGPAIIELRVLNTDGRLDVVGTAPTNANRTIRITFDASSAQAVTLRAEAGTVFRILRTH